MKVLPEIVLAYVLFFPLYIRTDQHMMIILYCGFQWIATLMNIIHSPDYVSDNAGLNAGLKRLVRPFHYMYMYMYINIIHV